MTYSDALSAAAPADTDLISQGDDAIRTHVRALRERLESVFQDVDSDPMALKPGSVSTAQLDPAMGLRKILFGSVSLTAGAGTGGVSGSTAVVGASPGDIVACNWPAGFWAIGYVVGGYVGSSDNVVVQVMFAGDWTTAPGGSATVDFAVIKQ